MMQFIQADATRLPFADKTFDLVFTSPPYTDARTYGIGAQRKCGEWIRYNRGICRETRQKRNRLRYPVLSV